MVFSILSTELFFSQQPVPGPVGLHSKPFCGLKPQAALKKGPHCLGGTGQNPGGRKPAWVRGEISVARP
ncbi:MAG: hypothetical protein CVU22_04785 [Betaproteobacteria bacterium HGW-Betaproteobacteria-16]|nr:MAG: hypothetical protein CVU22_04785 [Betaproteobacteria bacterium HGW-Betaproteobacteria-16]